MIFLLTWFENCTFFTNLDIDSFVLTTLFHIVTLNNYIYNLALKFNEIYLPDQNLIESIIVSGHTSQLFQSPILLIMLCKL